MSTVTDAVFFLNAGKVIREMMMTEFEALLDGIVQAPEFKSAKIQAVHLQITDKLKIKSLVSFVIGFTKDGSVDSDWNIPFNQLLQSAGRGPDLGAGITRWVTRSQCSVPWHQSNLWDPDNAIVQMLVKQVAANRLGIVISDEAWQEAHAVPTLKAAAPPVLDIPTVKSIPTVAASPKVATESVPTLQVADIPLAKPTQNADAGLQQELQAMKSAYAIKFEKLQSERDSNLEKSRETIQSLKSQAKEHVESLLQEFKQELAQKDQQLASLRNQIEHEQRRYSELKEQHVEQAASFQHDRENLMEQLESGQGVETAKIEALKTAFTRELSARIEAEVAIVNEQLATREVELFYRDEQMAIFKDEVQRLKAEKQALLTDSGKKILKSMEDNGVTFVAFHVGVGHITLAVEDIGRYIEDRNAYLAERCGISLDVFEAWQAHFNQPSCNFVDQDGVRCAVSVPRVEWAASFTEQVSDRCAQHKSHTA
jgi:hypothetical protein